MPHHSFNHNDYEIIARDVMYEGVFRIARYTLSHRLFKGGWTGPFQREILERRSAASLLPYDPLLDRVILIEQFRAGALAKPSGPWLTEIVAGTFEVGETPQELAIREAKEEAGCDVKELELIADYFVSAGGSNEYSHIFCGKVDASQINGIHGLADEHEDIRVLNLPAEEAFARIKNNEIKAASCIIALQWLELNRQWLRDKWLIQKP